jgi:hypothetical protein
MPSMEPKRKISNFPIVSDPALHSVGSDKLKLDEQTRPENKHSSQNVSSIYFTNQNTTDP